MKKHLTDRLLKSLANPAPAGKRHVVWDGLVSGFGVRVNPKGEDIPTRLTFIAMRRLKGDKYPTRYTIGLYGVLTLADAREAARGALQNLAEGKDPLTEKKKRIEAERQRRDDTFSTVAEEFIKRHVSTLRSARHMEGVIRRELISRWGDKPVTDITRRDVVEMVEEIAGNGTRPLAHRAFTHAHSLFDWAIERSIYGIEHSPCASIKRHKLIGELEPRTNVLGDEQIKALWEACEDEDYPFGPMTKLLLLTGQRLRQVAEASWGEIDLEKKLWVIPAKRAMKGNRSHEVPLSKDAVAILKWIDEEKRWKNCDYIFTTTGKSPVSGFGKAKERLDKRMAELRAKELGVQELDEEHEKKFLDWTNHDLRRTVRTRLSELRVPDLVCELVIGHTKPELHKVYDQHKYRDEKREALEKWAGKLRSILSPERGKVVKLRP